MKKQSKKKNVVRLSESKLRRIVGESIKKVLKEDMDGINQDYDDNRRYDIYVCEWIEGGTNTYWDSQSGRDSTTLEEFKSDAWSYCEFAEYPTIAILYDETSGEALEYYCSPHFTMAKYGK